MQSHSDIKEFTQLVTSTNKLFHVAQDDTKQGHIFSAALALSERFATLNELSPRLTDWLLGTHISSLPHSVRIVLVRIALICRLCTNLGYRQRDCQQLLIASILDTLCIAELIELQAQKIPLDEKQIAQWRKRSSSILTRYEINTHSYFELADVLAKIPHYEYRIMSNRAKPMYAPYARVVAFANLVSRKMLSNKTGTARALPPVLIQLYNKTADANIRQLCSALMEHALPQIAGATQTIEAEPLIYLGQSENNDALFIRGSLQKPRVVKAKRVRWQYNTPTELESISSLRRAITLQLHANLDKPNTPAQSNLLMQLASHISALHNGTEEDAAQYIKQTPELAQSVCKAARKYNRNNLVATSTGQAISMIGLGNIQHFASALILEEAFYGIKHPMQAFIHARVSKLIQVIEALGKADRTIAKDQLSAAFYAYFLSLLLLDTKLSHSRALKGLSDASAPLSHFIGSASLADEDMQTAAAPLLANNLWFEALLSSEDKDPLLFNDRERLCCLIKQLSFYMFDSKPSGKAWQEQFIATTLEKLFAVENGRDFGQQLALNTAPYEAI